MPRTIVLGWLGRDEGFSGYSNRPRACIWLNEGTSRDLRSAREYAAKSGYRVFVFPITEPLPLQKARALV
jgi:hypothetical protein